MMHSLLLFFLAHKNKKDSFLKFDSVGFSYHLYFFTFFVENYVFKKKALKKKSYNLTTSRFASSYWSSSLQNLVAK